MLVDILGNNTPQVRGYIEDEDRFIFVALSKHVND